MALPVLPGNIPDELKAIDQWIAWQEIDGKKVAVNAAGYPCKWNASKEWMPFKAAHARYEEFKLAGIGFVLTSQHRILGIDLDETIDARTIKVSTYAEMSPSGKGIRAFGYVEGLDISKHPKGVGLFTEKRWLSVTGQRVSDVGYLADCTDCVDDLLGSIDHRNGSGKKASQKTFAFALEKLKEVLRENWRFAKIWSFEATEDYDTLSEMDGAVAWHLIKSGWTNEEVAAAITEFRHRLKQGGFSTSGKEDRLDYPLITAEKARAAVGREIEEIDYLDLDSALDIPPLKWLINGIIPEESVGVLWGKWGTCKTFFMLDMTMRLICEQPWLFGQKTKYGDVLYVLSEGLGGLGDRLRAWFRLHKDARRVHKVAFWRSAPQITNSSDVNDIRCFIERRLPNCRLIVIDTLSRMIVGQNENDSMFMSKVVDQMTMLSQRLGLSVVMLHHPTKGGEDRPSTLRGSGAIVGGADFSIEVREVFIPGNFRRPVALHGIYEIHCDKARGGMEFEPFPIYLRRSGSGVAIDTHPMLTDWMKHRRRVVQGISADQFVHLLEFRKMGKSPATIEGLLRKSGIGLSRTRIEQLFEEMFPSSYKGSQGEKS